MEISTNKSNLYSLIDQINVNDKIKHKILTERISKFLGSFHGEILLKKSTIKLMEQKFENAVTTIVFEQAKLHFSMKEKSGSMKKPINFLSLETVFITKNYENSNRSQQKITKGLLKNLLYKSSFYIKSFQFDLLPREIFELSDFFHYFFRIKNSFTKNENIFKIGRCKGVISKIFENELYCRVFILGFCVTVNFMKEKSVKAGIIHIFCCNI